jgi:hypothetical protein
MRTLRQINAVYEQIIHSDMSARVKALKLKKLLSELVRDYKIPELKLESFKKEHPEIFYMYEKISSNITLD